MFGKKPKRGDPYITVIGGVNMDIGGRPDNQLVPADSNPGKVFYSAGGVGRNIAHNMALLGLEVKLITALGDDSNGHLIADSCKKNGIDISDSLWTKEDSTSVYLFVCDQDGDMHDAISDMRIYRRITPEFLQSRMSVINGSRLVVIDTNIPMEAIQYLADHCTAPIFADPVSTTKAQKLLPSLGKLHTVTPNRQEAEILSGICIDSEEALEQAGERLLDMGLKQVFITLGGSGLYAATKYEKYRFSNYPNSHLVNATGAGDAMMAGFIYGQHQGRDFTNISLSGLAAASLAIESQDTINSQMSSDLLEQRVEEIKTKSKHNK